MKFLEKLEQSRSFWFLTSVSVLFFFLRLPSLFEPYWYGDEGIYQSLGLLVRNGELLYSGAWDNKPPLLYLIYALFNADQFWTRTTSLLIGLFSIWTFYFLSKKIFLQKNIPELITGAYAFLFGIRLIEGNIANAENFMLFPIILSALLIYHLQSKKNKSINVNLAYFFSGLLLGIAFLLKIVAVFDLLAFFSFIIIINVSSFNDLLKTITRCLLPITIGFAIPILLITSYFLYTESFKDFYAAILSSNVGYVGYGNKLIIPQGFLILKSAVLGLFILVLYFKKKMIPNNILFVLIWLAFSLFNALFSQRPYTHYLLVLLPSFCLVLGMVLSGKKRTILGFITLALVLIFIAVNFNLKGKLLDYYINYISFANGSKSISDYQKFFDGNTPRDYEISRYIKANTKQNESIFIWGNNSQVYKLSNKIPPSRYVVAYHITNFKGALEEVEKTLEIKKPKLIIVMPNVSAYPFSLNKYSEKMEIQGVKFYEKVL